MDLDALVLNLSKLFLSNSLFYFISLSNLIMLLMLIFYRRSSQDDSIEEIVMFSLFSVSDLSLAWGVKGCSFYFGVFKIFHRCL